MASKREVVIATENYLRSKGYNNSTGKYDRVIMGVKSLLGETLLAYGSPEFERAIQQETERMLKKYVKDSAMEYDPVMCMMVPKKANDSLRMPRNLFDREANVIRGKENEFLTKVRAECAKISNLKDLDDFVDEIANYGYPYSLEKDIDNAIKLQKTRIQKKDSKANDVSMVYDEVMAMMKPVTAKDQKTMDFSSSDAKKVFEYIDRHVTKDMNDYPREIERAKTPDDCERLNNAIKASLDDAVDEYLQIWNEVGLYAQKRKNEIVDRYGKLMSQAFKKYNELKAKE